jgi:thiamine-monophosphate kinase
MEQKDIRSFGGELGIIKKLVKPVTKDNWLIEGPGDDCAVLKSPEKGILTLISSDMYTNGDHFSDKYFTPTEIGSKVMEASFSDIVAMGGKPKYALVNISFKFNINISFVRSIFRGIYKSCDFHNTSLIGGDIVKAPILYISTTVIGTVEEKFLKLRRNAKVGDLIKVTGHLGASAIGRILFKRKYLGHANTKKCHTAPLCRTNLIDKINPYANAMQDISDGVGSELFHICEQSKTGALIYEDKLPIKLFTIHSSRAIKVDPAHMALYGGEDYELIYTIKPKDAEKTPGTVIGEITESKRGINMLLKDNTTKVPLEKGYQHFG